MVVLGNFCNFIPILRGYPIDIAANLFNAFLIAYAIFRYQLLDIRLVVRKGLLYSIPTAIIGAGYFLIVYLTVSLFHTLAGYQVFFLSLTVAAITAVAVEPLRNMVQSWIDRLFFREKYDSALMLQRLSRTATLFLNLDRLTNKILDEVTQTMHIERAAFFLRHEESGEFHLTAQRGPAQGADLRLRKDHPVVNWLSDHERALTRHDVDIMPQFKALWGQEREDLERIGAELFIPLKVKGELVGISTVGPKLSEEAYSQDDQRTLTTLANQTAVAIEKARLFAALGEERERLQLLYDVARQASGGLDLEKVLTWLVERITAALGGKVGHLFILEPESARLRLRALIGVDALPAAIDERLDLRLGQGVAGWVALHGKAVVLSDVSKDERWLYMDEIDHGMRSMISVPLLLGEETMGVLNVLHPQVGYFDDPVYSHLLMAISRQMAMTIRDAWLRKELRERMEESSALYQVSRSLVSALDLDTLLKQILDAVRDTFGYSTTAILLLDESGAELYVKAARGLIEQAEGVRIKIGKEGITGWVAQHGEMLYVPDVSADPRYIEPVKTEESIRSEVALPLKVGTRLVGVLDVESTELKSFNERDFKILPAIADQVAIAIENARLYSDLEQSLEELKQTQAQLIQASKLSAIGELISGVAHELNNPLTSVIGYAQLLQQDEELSSQTKGDLERIHNGAIRAHKIVENLLVFARQRKPTKKYMDINKIIEQTLAIRAHPLRVDNIEVVRELEMGLPQTVVDPNQMQQVFLNLINNAHYFMVKAHGRGKLTIRSQSADGKIRVSIIDNGPGIPKENLDKIFDPFFTTKEVGEGTGLGLSVSYGIVQDHGGRIWAESPSTELGTGEEGEGATFVVELPIKTEQEIPSEEAPVVERKKVVTGKRILVVDDEESILSLFTRILKGVGYEVDSALNGKDAIQKLEKEWYDLIIADIKMPELDGRQLYQWLSEKGPEMARRLIFTTGDTVSLATQEFLETTGSECLVKPFGVEQVKRKVREALTAQEDSSA